MCVCLSSGLEFHVSVFERSLWLNFRTFHWSIHVAWPKFFENSLRGLLYFAGKSSKQDRAWPKMRANPSFDFSHCVYRTVPRYQTRLFSIRISARETGAYVRHHPNEEPAPHRQSPSHSQPFIQFLKFLARSSKRHTVASTTLESKPFLLRVA